MITLKNIFKKYGDLIVFENFNLELQKNKITCIMAPSGKGKTTLIRILMGFENADNGTISGLENAKLSAVFQEDRLCENLDTYTNIVLPHINKGSFHAIKKASLDEELALIGLDSCGTKPASALSGGMKRRVAILRALYADYDVLFLDEPFKGLDEETKQNTMEFLLNKTKGKTVIYITHDKSELDFINPDEVILL